MQTKRQKQESAILRKEENLKITIAAIKEIPESEKDIIARFWQRVNNIQKDINNSYKKLR